MEWDNCPVFRETKSPQIIYPVGRYTKESVTKSLIKGNRIKGNHPASQATNI